MAIIICMHDKGLDFYELDPETDQFNHVNSWPLIGYTQMEIRDALESCIRYHKEKGDKILVINKLSC